MTMGDLKALAVGIIIAAIGILAMFVRLIGQRTQAMTERTRVLLGFAVAPVAAYVSVNVIDGLMNFRFFVEEVYEVLAGSFWFLGAIERLGAFYILTIALGVPAHSILRFRAKRSAGSYRLTGILIGAVLVVVVLPRLRVVSLSPHDFNLWVDVGVPTVITAACGMAAAEALWLIAVRPADGRP